MNTWARLFAIAVVVALVAAPAAGQIFVDMRDHPSRRAAERLAAKGIVTRLPDGRLAPDEPLMRLDMANFLGRIVGVPTGGIRIPDFRDIDQIPPADRLTVAMASIMGTVSTTKAEIKKGTVVYQLTTNKAVYAPDEMVELTFTISNAGPGQETEVVSADRNRIRLKLTDRNGMKAGLEGELYIDARNAQGVQRQRVARVKVTAAGGEGSTTEVVEEGEAQAKQGLKVFFLADVPFDYSTSQFHDFVIRDGDANEIARWSLNRPFVAVERPIPLAAHQTMSFQTRWRQLDQNDQPVKAGRYELTATQTTKESPTSLQITFQRGLIAPFADNTFRPRTPVTRVDLAVMMVRALGFETEAIRRANERLIVADAGSIAPDARGAVVVALDKKIMLALADNTFSPAKTATRGDAVFALNALMESLNRYDYTVATLREVRGGPPPVVVVTDGSNQIRTHRVAVVSAVYRGNVPVLLLNLRPGDQLKMLKPSDAGEVMYIEATAGR